MGQPIPAQHPSVVLRSHFNLVRTLLAIAMAAVLALTAVVVILANDEDQLSSATKATPAVQHQPQTQAGTRYDGGPEEGTRGAIATPAVPNVAPPASSIAAGAESAYQNLRGAGNSRYDGGPDEGTRGPLQFQAKERAGGPTMIPNGPGSR
jgi:hypothetical protein